MKLVSVMISMLALTSANAIAANRAADTNTSESNYNVSYSSPNIKPISRIIPEVGLSLGDVTYNNSSARTGLQAGALVDLLGRGNLVLESGLLYKQLGTVAQNITFSLNYLTIPVAAKYYFSGQHMTSLYGVGGLMPGFNVAHSYSLKNGQSGDINDLQGYNTNTFDLELLLGVGGKLTLSRTASLILEVDYTRGLTNVLTQPGTSQASLNNIGFAFVSGVAVEL